MENNTPFFEPLLERAEVYGKTSFDLFKLKTVEKTSDVLSTGVSRSITLLILCFFLIFVGLGISLWLGDVFGKLYYGFFCVGAFYGLSCIVFYFLLHKSIKRKASDSIISQMLN